MILQEHGKRDTVLRMKETIHRLSEKKTKMHFIILFNFFIIKRITDVLCSYTTIDYLNILYLRQLF